MTNTLLATSAFTFCMIINAGGGDTSHEAINVPTNYPPNWLEKHVATTIMQRNDDGTIVFYPPQIIEKHVDPLRATTIIQRNDDGTVVLRNATLTFSFKGNVLKPADVVAFADLGSRSVMLKAKKDSQAYKALAHNMTIMHGDSREPRFEVVGELQYRAPVTNGQIDLLNPVPVLDVKSVRYYLVPQGSP